MQWEIINTEPIVPICDYCDKTTKQMARFHIPRDHGYTHYICSDCARFVKDAMNKWEGLKSTNYIEQTGSIFDSKQIDSVIGKQKYYEDHFGESRYETKDNS